MTNAASSLWSWMTGFELLLVWGIAGALLMVPLTAVIVTVCGQCDRSRWIAKLLSS